MERTPTELTLEELLPQLEAEHDLETANMHVRDAIWNLIDAAEAYMLARHDQRTKKAG
jgi:hypothetical protein